MKPHKILKTFKGSQHGNDNDEFHEGTVRPLSADLAKIAVKEGWAEPHIEPKVIEPEEKAIEAAPANKMVKPPENKRKK